MIVEPTTDHHRHPGHPGPPAAFAAALRLGAPQSHGSLTVVPLAFWRDRGPHYDTLAAALRAGTLHVTEISAGGSVPELKVIELYKAEYRRLAAESRIANFLSVLAMRNTRAILRAGGTVN